MVASSSSNRRAQVHYYRRTSAPTRSSLLSIVETRLSLTFLGYFAPLRRNHLALLHFLRFPLLLQVKTTEQSNYSYRERRRRGDIGRNLGLKDLLRQPPFVPPSDEALQSSPQVDIHLLVLLGIGVYMGNDEPRKMGSRVSM